LSGAHAASRDKQRHRLRPVVPSRLHDPRLRADRRSNSGSSPELSRDHEQHLSIQPPRVQVVDQGRHGLIVNWQTDERVAEHVAVDRVGIPVVGQLAGHFFTRRNGILHDHRHEAHATLHEAPRHQGPLAPWVPAVAVAQCVGFLRQIERLARPGAGQEVEGLLMKMVDGPHGAGLIDALSHAIKPGPQRHPVVKPAFHFPYQRQVLDLKRFGIRVSHHEEGMRLRPQVRAPEAERVDPFPTAIDPGDVIWQAAARFAAHAGDH